MARRTTAILCILVLGAASAGLRPSAAEPVPEHIAWAPSLREALKTAISKKLPVLIYVAGPEKDKDGNDTIFRGLRLLLDKSFVVERAQAFVCVKLTRKDEPVLKKVFRLKGPVVLPQFLFAQARHVAGEKPMYEHRYWQFGFDEGGVKAMVGLMNRALKRHRVKEAMPRPTGTSPEARKAWIDQMVRMVRDGNAEYRLEALATMAKQDKDGDCRTALVPLIEQLAKSNDLDRLKDVLRYVTVEPAVAPLVDLLEHENSSIRGHAAVTLEYIGSPACVAPLLAQLKREKEDEVANHMYRALGRCGVGDDNVRKRLLKQATPAKGADFCRFGAVIGLAYFEKDAKAARGLERHLTRLGMPFQTGSKAHVFLRALTVWCLGEIRDPKSGPFLQRRFLNKFPREPSAREEAVMTFYGAVARKCEGSDGLQDAINKGLENYRWRDRAGDLPDASRKQRNMKLFRPKGEWGNTSTHQ